MKVKNLSFSYHQNPFIENLNINIPKGKITTILGPNGSGKSTLLEALAVACGFNPEGGTKNYIFSTYDSHSQLHEAIRVVTAKNLFECLSANDESFLDYLKDKENQVLNQEQTQDDIIEI